MKNKVISITVVLSILAMSLPAFAEDKSKEALNTLGEIRVWELVRADELSDGNNRGLNMVKGIGFGVVASTVLCLMTKRICKGISIPVALTGGGLVGGAGGVVAGNVRQKHRIEAIDNRISNLQSKLRDYEVGASNQDPGFTSPRAQ